MGRGTPHRVGRTVVLCLAVMTASGCATKTPRQTPLMRNYADTDLSAAEVRFRSYEYARHFVSLVEATADDIIAGADDPQIRLNALLWKANATAAMHAAVFGPDPLLGFWDALILTAQMRQFLEVGAGSDLFGAWQSRALAVARTLEEDVWRASRAASRSGDSTRGEAFVAEWVGGHPITSLAFRRDRTAAVFIEWVQFDDPSGIAAAASIDAQVADLLERLEMYGEHLPKQARWQAQLLASDYLQSDQIGTLLADVQRISAEIEAVRVSLDSIGAVFGDFQGILNRAVGGLGDNLTYQRETAFEEVDALRVAAMADVAAEAERLVVELSRQREAVMADMEGLTVAAIDRAVNRFERLANRLFWRFTLLVVVASAAAFGAALYLGRRRPGAAGP